MNIDPTISKYIDVAMERMDKRTDKAIKESVKLYKAENDHHIGALMEFFEGKIAIVMEHISTLPNRDEVRRIFHEENEKFTMEFSIVKNEVIDHGRRLSKHDKQLADLAKR